ncbi:MAG TPA: alpha/beta hydrolase-fold protein [Chryseolinea sp.]
MGQTKRNDVSNHHGVVLTKIIQSEVLKENKVGLNVNRSVKIYLPQGYETSKTAYPVLYWMHNFFTDSDKLFEGEPIVELIERALSAGIIKDFILVAADYSTNTTGSIYENSPVSGRWLDFTTKELVPFIDSNFRTLKSRDSRAVAGDFIGGRGALKLAMVHPEVFSVVYALHPVATGMGSSPWISLDLDYKKMMEAKSVTDLNGTGRSLFFLVVCQAFLPNPSRPPLYCDFLYEPDKDGKLVIDGEHMARAKMGFHLEETIDEAAAGLRTMRGFAFDWGRFDPNQDHVIANRVFSRRLEDLGVEHEAEEYRGDPFSRVWTDDGRFYTRLLPFVAKHLVFDKD